MQFTDGRSTIARYLVKVNGSYTMAWDITASANLNVNDGATRTLTINGPGDVYGGLDRQRRGGSTITYNTLDVPADRHDAASARRSCSIWACRRCSRSEGARTG